MHEILRTTSESLLFEVTAAPYLVLDTNLRIQGANPAYLRATRRSRDELLGASMSDAFPDNPQDATATGVRNLGASLERVLRRGAPDDMGVQRYDIPDAAAPGGFRPKTWSPVNTPLHDADGRVVGVLHHVEDITAVHDLLQQAGGADPWAGLRQPTALLHRAMLALARYERASTTLESARAPSHTDSERDALWHRILHTARYVPRRDCAAAVCHTAAHVLPAVDAAAITLHGTGLLPHHLAVSSPWPGAPRNCSGPWARARP